MQPKTQRFCRILLVASLLTLASGPSLSADPAIKQPITIVVGTPVGGGYDAYARLLARHYGSFLSGEPKIIVQNMPGAGSLIAANWLANSAPKDGTALAILPNATIFETMLGNSRARFDASKLNMLGSLNDWTAVAMVWHDTPYTTARDFFTHEVLVGASAPGSGNSVFPNLLNALIGTKFKVVNGYPGSAGIELAMERGEVQAMVGDDLDMFRATRRDWFRDGKTRILMQATLTRHPDLAEVPTALEFASAEQRDVLALLIARQTYAGLFLAPPGVSPSTLALLRDGFDKMVEGEDFRRDAEQSHLAVHASKADAVTRKLANLLASPPAVITRATAVLRTLLPN
jgi:tripartite-type tricarboxylate transporter receptor subunit TctC